MIYKIQGVEIGSTGGKKKSNQKEKEKDLEYEKKVQQLLKQKK